MTLRNKTITKACSSLLFTDNNKRRELLMSQVDKRPSGFDLATNQCRRSSPQQAAAVGMNPPLVPKRSGRRHKPQQKASGGKSSTYRALVLACSCTAQWLLYLYLPKKQSQRPQYRKARPPQKQRPKPQFSGRNLRFLQLLISRYCPHGRLITFFLADIILNWV